MQPNRRLGFTLVEVLVVIAITSLLLGLTLAAVQRVRATAHRAQCGNNLRQLSIAVHQFHQSHGRLPPGTLLPGKSTDFGHLAWSARVLPYLEQSALWTEIVWAYQQDPTRRIPPHYARLRGLAVYSCPADGRIATKPEDCPGLTSYLGVSGTRSDRTEGLLYLGSSIRIADITDGLSNTLMIGERPPSADLRFGWWHSGIGQPGNGSGGDAFLGVADRNIPRIAGAPEWDCPEGPYRFTPGVIKNQCDSFHFWSPHPGGANFAFADGSVRFLRYSADTILPAMATRAGGEVVSSNE